MFKIIESIFECENSKFNGKTGIDEIVYTKGNLKVSFCYIDEGFSGYYNPDDEEDEPLLRFDVYKKVNGEWEAIDNGSYCTQNNVFTSIRDLKSMLKTIWEEMNDALEGGYSGKKTAEYLSWITP